MNNIKKSGFFNLISSDESKYRADYESGKNIYLGSVSFVPGKLSEVAGELTSVEVEELKSFAHELKVDLLGPIERSVHNMMIGVYDPRDEIGDLRLSTKKRLENMMEDLEVVENVLEQLGGPEVDENAKLIAETLCYDPDEDEFEDIPDVELPDTLKALIKEKQKEQGSSPDQDDTENSPGF